MYYFIFYMIIQIRFFDYTIGYLKLIKNFAIRVNIVIKLIIS